LVAGATLAARTPELRSGCCMKARPEATPPFPEEGGALHEEHPVVARVGEEEYVIVRRGEKKRCAQ
jgi:hypothetical protein